MTGVIRAWLEAAGNRHVQENLNVSADGVATVETIGPRRVDSTRLATDQEVVMAFLNAIESSPVIVRIGESRFGWKKVGGHKVPMIWVRVKGGYEAREATFFETLATAKAHFRIK